MTNKIALNQLLFSSPIKPTVRMKFDTGVNVICGASDTGKSFLLEAIDFMFGASDPLRDLPERVSYEAIYAHINSFTIARSMEGGNFSFWEGVVDPDGPKPTKQTLKAKLNADKEDNLPYLLLKTIGLKGKKLLRSKKSGKTQNLGYRDIAHLTIIEEEIITRNISPILSGQFTKGTSEYALFKLLVTGVDDSFLDDGNKLSAEEEEEARISVKVLDKMIESYNKDLSGYEVDADEVDEQLVKLQNTIEERQEELSKAQTNLNQLRQKRSTLWNEIETFSNRMDEISGLMSRFQLLEDQYKTDLSRLNGIKETGHVFDSLPVVACVLCGADPAHQQEHMHSSSSFQATVDSTDAEIIKIEHLLEELHDTQRGLKSEAVDLRFKTDNQKEDLQKIQDEINTVVSDVIQPARSTYAEVVEFHSQLRSGQNLLQKISELEFQKQQQEAKTGSDSEPDKPASEISKSTLSDFSKVYKNILKEWHFPDHEEVYFDEKTKDFVINGKPRGSRGKGLRAITHAAFTIALLEYCQKKKLPHPGFVVLDSPLLAYWKPEGDDDKELQGTDLEERFYEYLIEKHADNQIIIMENKHPADDLMEKMNVTIFTKNEAQGRYGLFPPVENEV